jgi:3',5'-cyclic AMP phosphodiesterase CpdA
VRIVHLADAHVARGGSRYLPGVDLVDRFAAALAAVSRLDPRPDHVVLGGDILDEPSPDYGLLAQMVEGMAWPAHLCPGNHDSVEAYSLAPLATFPAGCPGYYTFDAGELRCIILHSSAALPGSSFPPPGRATAPPPHGAGYLDGPQLDWLARELAGERRAVIFLHHPPVDVGIPWLDAIRLLNAGEFWEVVGPAAPRVAGIFFAHLHAQVSMVRRDILLASPPAAGWQFRADPSAARAETSDELPGFNVIDAGGTAPDLRVRTVRLVPQDGRLHRP